MNAFTKKLFMLIYLAPLLGFSQTFKSYVTEADSLKFLLVPGFCFPLQAQTTSRAGFDVNIYSPSANQFFDRYQDINHVIIFYDKGNVETIEIFFRGRPEPALGERYILTFDGDVYLFNKKYKQFPLPNSTTAELTNFQGIRKMNDLNFIYDLTTTIRRDSLVHHFDFYTYEGNIEPFHGSLGNYPVFNGDILKLEEKIEQKFKQWQPIKVIDSMIIMSGLVEKNGTIGKLKLIEGRPSVYSSKVLEFMGREATSWLPKVDGGGKRAWPVRISVRVNKDESIKVSIL